MTRPSRAASASIWASAFSAFRLVRTCSIASFTKLFLPGNCSSGASKLPSPNSLTQASAFSVSSICPATIIFTEDAISLKPPLNIWACKVISILPFSCSPVTHLTESTIPLSLPLSRSKFLLISAFLPGYCCICTLKSPSPSARINWIICSFSCTWPPTIAFTPCTIFA